MSEPNVVREVVTKSLCCGCGVCAGVCPENAIEMRFNAHGEVVPALTGDCVECQFCLKVCPALEVGEPVSPDELSGFASAIQEDPDVGRSIESYVGYSHRHRRKAASGGMATLTLEQLFVQDKIDAAVCVGPSEREDRLFDAVIVPTESRLLSCSSSRYYPVEFSSALSHILENEGRYAVVALPCAVTAIRKAQRAVPILRERIRYVLGLVCGHGVSKRFTNFLLAVAGLDETSVTSVDFRYAGRSRNATNFAFRAQKARREWSRPLFFEGLYGRLWGGRFFVPRACDFCNDLFAPLSDATFMDAWLPEHTGDSRGTSIVVVRHPEIAELLQQGKRTGACDLRPIDIELVRQSQSGPLAYKTVYLPLRVSRAERDGQRIPRSFPRAPLRNGLRERLARIKHTARELVCQRAFDRRGQARHLWVSILTAHLRAQCAWWAARRRVRGLHHRARGENSGRIGDK